MKPPCPAGQHLPLVGEIGASVLQCLSCGAAVPRPGPLDRSPRVKIHHHPLPGATLADVAGLLQRRGFKVHATSASVVAQRGDVTARVEQRTHDFQVRAAGPGGGADVHTAAVGELVETITGLEVRSCG